MFYQSIKQWLVKTHILKLTSSWNSCLNEESDDDNDPFSWEVLRASEIKVATRENRTP